MTKAEAKCIEKLKDRHDMLVSRMKKPGSTYFSDLDETTKLTYFMDYGECLGIESALAAFGIYVRCVDDMIRDGG